MFCGDDAGASLQEDVDCLAHLCGQEQSLGGKSTCGKGQMNSLASIKAVDDPQVI